MRKPYPQSTKPAFDVFDLEKFLIVVMELYVNKEDDIYINVDNFQLTISVNILKQRIYCQKIALPCATGEIIKKSYKDNILEVRLNKIADICNR